MNRYKCYEVQAGMSEDDLTCAVCLSLFTAPKTLPCGHSFCQICIHRVIETSFNAKINCPKCQNAHSRESLHRLRVNQLLRKAVMSVYQLELPHQVPIKLSLTHTIHTPGLLFRDPVLAVTLLPNQHICLATCTTLFCYGERTGPKAPIAWRNEMEGITSLACNEDHLFTTQHGNKLTLSTTGFSCWDVCVLDFQGRQLRVLQAGLGQHCSLTTLPSGWLLLADTGSFQHHAKQCLIIMTDDGMEKQVLEVDSHRPSLLKPTHAVADAQRNCFMVYDEGDRHIKSLTVSNSKLNQLWQLKVRDFSTMATNTSHSLVVIITANKLLATTFNGEMVTELDLDGTNDRPQDVSLSDEQMVIGGGKEVQVYSMVTSREKSDDNV